jgi:DNA-binding beta-propeller fold protein YncE
MLTFSLTLLLAAADAGFSEPAAVALPGGPPVAMDYLAYEAKNDRVWVPAGNTGRVDVFDVKTKKLTAVEGFATKVVKGHDGKERIVGPSSATVGNGDVYVGNRADSTVCAIDVKSLTKEGCATLPSAPDGVVYVAATREVWVTTPKGGSVTILDVRKPAEPKVVGTLAVDGPEGFSVDAERGLFYTNQEDADRTLVFDVKSRKLLSTWNATCGKEGPRGLALDAARRHLFVACASGALKVLDAAKSGAVLGEVQAGEGLDNIDYDLARHRVLAAGGRSATLALAEDGADGALKLVSMSPSAPGTRVVVVDAHGTAYVADSKGGRLLVFAP